MNNDHLKYFTLADYKTILYSSIYIYIYNSLFTFDINFFCVLFSHPVLVTPLISLTLEVDKIKIDFYGSDGCYYC